MCFHLEPERTYVQLWNSVKQGYSTHGDGDTESVKTSIMTSFLHESFHCCPRAQEGKMLFVKVKVKSCLPFRECLLPSWFII